MRAHKKAHKSFFSRFQIANSVIFLSNFLGDFRANFLENMALLRQILLVSAAVDHSSPLDFPSQKSFPLFFFLIKKGLRHLSQKQFCCSLIVSFLVCRYKLKSIFFGQTAATAIILLSYHNIQDLSSHSIDKIQKLHMQSYS